MLCLLVALAPAIVWGHGAWLGLPQLQFSAATLATIDSNVQNGDTPVIVGDIVEIIAKLDSITDGTVSGPGGWITFYVPPGTQVVGAAMLDASLNPIPARDATSPVSGDGTPKGWGEIGANTFNVTANGWNPVTLPSECTIYGYTKANCNAGMAFLYGDTGIFYSTRADTALYTGDGGKITKCTNGYQIKPTQAKPWTSIGCGGTARVHNKWDAVQSNAFGSSGPVANPGFSTLENTDLATGRGPTPYHAGSPVAGPDVASPLDRYGTVGPWRRISYPGSCIATNSAALGPANGKASVHPEPVNNTTYPVSVCTRTTAGHVLSEANPLPLATNVVRFAIGGIHEGYSHRVMLRLKVLDPSVISVFNVAGSGGDASWSGSNKDNMWRYWIGAPANIPLGSQSFRLFLDKEIVAINDQPYTPGMTVPPDGTIRYRISYANTGAFLQTNVALRDVLPAQTVSTSNFTVVRGPNILPASNPTGGTFSFVTIPELPGLTGGAVEFDVTISAADGETVTNRAELRSNELPTWLVDEVPITVAAVIADLAVAKSVEVYDPNGLGLFAIPGQDLIYTITVTNLGSAVDASTLEIIDAIPAELTLFRGAFDGTTTEPVKFVDGTPSSALVCCDSTHISYSVDGGTNYNYLAPAGYDATITHLKVVPGGSMADSGTSFEIKFRAQIK